MKKTAGSWEINMEKLGSSTTKQRRELVATIDFTNSVIIWLVESPKVNSNVYWNVAHWEMPK